MPRRTLIPIMWFFCHATECRGGAGNPGREDCACRTRAGACVRGGRYRSRYRSPTGMKKAPIVVGLFRSRWRGDYYFAGGGSGVSKLYVTVNQKMLFL
jgi:hypothetical protein